jgi:thiamine-monophosphate kinase
MDESAFIAALRMMPLHPGARGLSDDAAQLEIGGQTLILTHDSMAEGTHFRGPDDAADDGGADMADVAWKLVASNLSDLAAKGAEPVGLLLSYSLGGGEERFLEGLREVTQMYGAPLFGGDTIAAKGPRTFGLTAIGRATCTPVPVRSGAQQGDALYVTGTLGRAMLGFEGDAAHLEAFTRPRPRLSEGRILAPHVTAMMDVSDGLLLDAFRMAEASDASLAIDGACVPVANSDRAEQCMSWGDDYELLFTLPPDIEPPVSATRIGAVEARGFAPLILSGNPIVNARGLGFEHEQTAPD